MKLTIILKKLDADGLGGQILEAMGMKRSAYEPAVFVTQHIQDPRIVAPVDVLESMWPVMYVEALMDEGIRPLRVFQKTDSTVGLTPLFASAKPDKLAVANILEAAANALEGGTCVCGESCKASADGATCEACGLPMAAAEEASETMAAAVDALAELAEIMAESAVCPDCGAEMVYDDGRDAYTCPECGYIGPNGPIEVRGDDVPNEIIQTAPLNASKGVIDKKTWKMIREKANDALEKAGFDGNGRFKTIGQANSKLADVLSNFGLQLGDVMSADLFREDSRTQNFSLEFVNPQDSFSPVAFDDSMVHYSYAKLSPDRIEVVAYLS